MNRKVRVNTNGTISLPLIGAIKVGGLTLLDAQAWATNAQLVATAPDRIGRDVLARLRRAAVRSPYRVSRIRA